MDDRRKAKYLKLDTVMEKGFWDMCIVSCWFENRMKSVPHCEFLPVCMWVPKHTAWTQWMDVSKPKCIISAWFWWRRILSSLFVCWIWPVLNFVFTGNGTGWSFVLTRELLIKIKFSAIWELSIWCLWLKPINYLYI